MGSDEVSSFLSHFRLDVVIDLYYVDNAERLSRRHRTDGSSRASSTGRVIGVIDPSSPMIATIITDKRKRSIFHHAVQPLKFTE